MLSGSAATGGGQPGPNGPESLLGGDAGTRLSRHSPRRLGPFPPELGRLTRGTRRGARSGHPVVVAVVPPANRSQGAALGREPLARLSPHGHRDRPRLGQPVLGAGPRGVGGGPPL